MVKELLENAVDAETHALRDAELDEALRALLTAISLALLGALLVWLDHRLSQRERA